MAKRIDPKLQAWIEARKRHHLTHAQVQMARELGFDPKSLGKIDNHHAERWKAPLPQFIESLYLKRFGRPPAEPVRSIEQIAAAKTAKKNQRREARAAQRSAAEETVPVRILPRYPDRKMSETLLDFAAPALGHLPPQPPLETFRQLMQIAIAAWNFGSMSFSIWRAEIGQDYGSEWNAMMAKAAPQARGLLDELMRRRASEPFNQDQRAVGEWSLNPDGRGSFTFRCDARLPRACAEDEVPPRPA